MRDRFFKRFFFVVVAKPQRDFVDLQAEISKLFLNRFKFKLRLSFLLLQSTRADSCAGGSWGASYRGG